MPPPSSKSTSRSQSSTRTDNLAAPTTSYLSARRPSFAPSLQDTFDQSHSQVHPETNVPPPANIETVTDTERTTTFGQDLRIVMRDAVGDAVGNMSISPTNRDIVLAARRGLFIIDLDSPLAIPRFLPQGGTWNIADVQWNPHWSHKEYVVSTSNEKLLVWNLSLSQPSSIQHILHQHYRAITDINWHPHEPDLVASTSIDSWIWVWDIRTPLKAELGLCAFNYGATQVKWNRFSPHLLASSHDDEVLLWDRRKGSLPLAAFRAHAGKIYGIDWSYSSSCSEELVTCSLDKTVKSWDLSMRHNNSFELKPSRLISTRYPVWRARHTPFGRGVLTMSQKGEKGLEMWNWGHEFAGNADAEIEPVMRFDGHQDLVREFVWRKGVKEGREEWQLITWGKDRTLRLWEVNQGLKDMMTSSLQTTSMEQIQVTSSANPIQIGNGAANFLPTASQSFRETPATSPRGTTPGNGVTTFTYPAEFPPPLRNRTILREVRALDHWQGLGTPILMARELEQTSATVQSTKTGHGSFKRKGATITKPTKARSGGSGLDQLTWLSKVRVASFGVNDVPGRVEVTSEGNSRGRDKETSMEVDEKDVNLSMSGSGNLRDRDERDNHQQLQDEITSSLAEFSNTKVFLENADIAVHRTCVIGLYGPWGESLGSSASHGVFLRVTFTFPPSYPYSPEPSASPIVEIERNPVIPPSTRAFLLRKLKVIRNKRPCMDECLRFLLGFYHSEDVSSDDEVALPTNGSDRMLGLARVREDIPEFRTVQGGIGPNGEVVFTKNPTRRFFGRQTATSVPQKNSPARRRTTDRTISHALKSPNVLADAIERLANIAFEHAAKEGLDVKPATNDAIRLMNLVDWTRSRDGERHRTSHSSEHEGTENRAIGPVLRRSTLYFRSAAHLVSPDRQLAERYQILGSKLTELCELNASVARNFGRPDHEQTFNLLQPIAAAIEGMTTREESASQPIELSCRLIATIHQDLCTRRDLQLMAMLAAILLQCEARLQEVAKRESHQQLRAGSHLSQAKPIYSPRGFCLAMQAMDNSSSSAHGVWASILSKSGAKLISPAATSAQEWQKSSLESQPQPSANSGLLTPKLGRTRSGMFSRRPTFSQIVAPPKIPLPPARELQFVLCPKNFSHKMSYRLLDEPTVQQFSAHIRAYAEILPRWELGLQRAELLKCIPMQCSQDTWLDEKSLEIAISPFTVHGQRVNCTWCKLPVTGLSHVCITCGHVSHLACRRNQGVFPCVSGCSCTCNSI